MPLLPFCPLFLVSFPFGRSVILSVIYAHMALDDLTDPERYNLISFLRNNEGTGFVPICLEPAPAPAPQPVSTRALASEHTRHSPQHSVPRQGTTYERRDISTPRRASPDAPRLQQSHSDVEVVPARNRYGPPPAHIRPMDTGRFGNLQDGRHAPAQHQQQQRYVDLMVIDKKVLSPQARTDRRLHQLLREPGSSRAADYPHGSSPGSGP